MSSQPPWETQIQPGWGSQPKPPEQPQPPQQQPPHQGGGWNQGAYPPPQQQPAQPPQQDRVQYPPYPPQQPPPPQFTPPQMPGQQPWPGEQPPAKNGRGRTIGIIAGVVVLVGAAAGVYALTQSGKSPDKPVAIVTTGSSSTPTTQASSSASFPNNSYTASTAPPSAASSTSIGASLDNAATDKTPFTPQGLVAATFTDEKHVTYTLQAAEAKPCAQVGDPLVQSIVRHVACTDFMAASWTDPQGRIIVSAMIIPFQDAATAADVYKKLAPATHTGDYAQWCPPAGKPGADACVKLAKATNVSREGKFGNYHRYLLITTAIYADLRKDDSQKDWLTAAAHGAFQNTLPGQ
jgi:hypothetical protein